MSLRLRSWTVRDLLGLIKCHLSLYIALTAVAGHALSQNRLSMASLGLGAWVLVLSWGAAMINNVQDRFHDRRLERTRNRILARGDLPAGPALAAGSLCILAGLAGLWRHGLCAFGLGVAAVACYNGIYTPMKHRGLKARFWAMVPGTFCGMIPPAIGWVSAGAPVTDPSGLGIFMMGLGVWQFPHFLLVFLKEGLPKNQSYGPFFTPGRLLHQVLVWTFLFSTSMLFFLLRGGVMSLLLSLCLLVLSLGLPLFMAVLFWLGKPVRRADLGFLALNFSMLSYTVIILLDRI